jgi:hypothetical protein
MKRTRSYIILVAIALLATACAGGGGATTYGTAGGSNATDFPLPASVSNFTKTGDTGINFQTALSLQDALAFYRDAFTQAGLTERTINTAITDTTFSVVFDGDPGGKAIVVQGVSLGNSATNVNVRYEDT